MSALQNNKGLTLVEVLIAMVVFLLVSLAMMQTALVGIDSNMINVLRDEAVHIAEITMNEARNAPFDSLAEGEHESNVSRDMRSVQGFQYAVTRTVTDLGVDNKQIAVTVGWQWKGENYTHSITTIRKR